MVSFSCENCGDVLTKKKLDPHRNQCRGASFSCLDCMVHFHGTDYRSHTSCISEAQKYEGALYRDKKSKNQKQNAQPNSQALVPRSAYVEDAQEDNRVAIVDAPPRAPSPPAPYNVFDFLVASGTPNASKAALPAADESRMIEDTRDDFQPSTDLVRVNGNSNGQLYDSQDNFPQNGFSYGHTPMAPSFERYDSYANFEDHPSESFYTPAPKYGVQSPTEENNKTSKKSDKKRKRGVTEVQSLDMALVRAQAERDAVMTDAPPILHSGLTGGLNRLLHRPEFPPSPDYSGGDWVDASPLSPMKRTKQTHKERDRGRDREPKPRKSSGQTTASTRQNGAWVRPRRDREDSNLERRRNRSDRDQDSDRRRRRSSSSVSQDARDRIVDPPGFKPVKAIEYRPERSASAEPNNDRALVRQEQSVVRQSQIKGNGAVSTISQSRADLFMSFVTKGPESERGCSINKALKRYHRERVDNWDDGASWGGMSKGEEEKELWKSLRIRRNDRGEAVVFFDS